MHTPKEDLMFSVHAAAMKSAAFYVASALTPIPSLFGVGPFSPLVASVIFGVTDVVRRQFVDPQLPASWASWTRDSMGPGGNYMDPSVLWQNFSVAAVCKACVVQALMFWGVLTLSGTYSESAAGLAATGFTSSVLYDFVMGFMK